MVSLGKAAFSSLTEVLTTCTCSSDICAGFLLLCQNDAPSARFYFDRKKPQGAKSEATQIASFQLVCAECLLSVAAAC